MKTFLPKGAGQTKYWRYSQIKNKGWEGGGRLNRGGIYIYIYTHTLTTDLCCTAAPTQYYICVCEIYKRKCQEIITWKATGSKEILIKYKKTESFSRKIWFKTMWIKVKQRRSPWENWGGVSSRGGRKEIRRWGCLRDEGKKQRSQVEHIAAQRQKRWGLKRAPWAHLVTQAASGGGWNITGTMECTEQQWEGLACAEASVQSTWALRQRRKRVVLTGTN